MIDLFEFGRHGPYIWAAYGVSIFTLAALFLARRRKLKRALEAERANNNKS